MKNFIKSACIYLCIVAVGLGIGFAAPRLVGWLKPGYVEGDFHAYYPDANTKVVLYGTSWCQFCAKSRSYFTEHHIPFLDLDIEKSPLAAKQHAALAGEGVPKILIGNRLINAFNPPEFEAALAKVNTSAH